MQLLAIVMGALVAAWERMTSQRDESVHLRLRDHQGSVSVTGQLYLQGLLLTAVCGACVCGGSS